MKSLFAAGLVLALASAGSASAGSRGDTGGRVPAQSAIGANPFPGARHLLVIALDGLRGDSLTCDRCAKPPALLSLIETGAFHRKVLAGGNQLTVSGPGWATQLTGFWARKHGVTSNDIDLEMRKPHLFSLIKQAYPGATTAVVADWENLTENLAPPDADFVASVSSSREATDVVREWLGRPNAPAAIFYYMQDTDVHACCYLPTSEFYQRKILRQDRLIQRVLDALVARPGYLEENWLIAVVSDHGGKGSSHGGQSLAARETPMILTNSYANPARTPYCRGDFTRLPLGQRDALTPHALDFLGIPNRTDGRKLPDCGS